MRYPAGPKHAENGWPRVSLPRQITSEAKGHPRADRVDIDL